MTKIESKDLERRRTEDFNFMVVCASKGNMSMYQLMRDRSLDKKVMTPSEKGEAEYASWFEGSS